MSIFDRFRPYPVLRTAIVNLKTGTAFRGIVWRRRGGYIVLRKAELIAEEGATSQPRPVDGEVMIERANVDFIQVVP